MTSKNRESESKASNRFALAMHWCSEPIGLRGASWSRRFYFRLLEVNMRFTQYFFRSLNEQTKAVFSETLVIPKLRWARYNSLFLCVTLRMTQMYQISIAGITYVCVIKEWLNIVVVYLYNAKSFVKSNPSDSVNVNKRTCSVGNDDEL